MNVLSLFDGMSCGQQALHELGIKVDTYYASEIDKYAIEIAQKNFPNTIQLGDVRTVKGRDLPQIDLLLGGSPCQGFSFAGQRLNFDDPRSKLFFEFARILKEVKPRYFLLENVRMKQECQDVISDYVGVKPIKINSSLVSAQNRVRLYWTNIPNILQPEERGLVLGDILDDTQSFVTKEELPDWLRNTHNEKQRYEKIKSVDEKASTLLATMWKGHTEGFVSKPMQVATATDFKGLDIMKRVYSPMGKSPTVHTQQGGNRQLKVSIDEKENYYQMNREGAYPNQQQDRIRKPEKPSNTLTATQSSIPKVVLKQRPRGANKGGVRGLDEKSPTVTISSWETNHHIVKGIHYRQLTPIECERLQTLPDNYTEGVSKTQRFKMIGNGWTIEVIKHILKNMEVNAV